MIYQPVCLLAWAQSVREKQAVPSVQLLSVAADITGQASIHDSLLLPATLGYTTTI